MTTTEVRKSPFTELQAMTTRLITQAEALAGLVARLKLEATGEPGDPEVTAQLDRVLDLIGAADLCANAWKLRPNSGSKMASCSIPTRVCRNWG